MPAYRIITIMADFGNAAYAGGKDSDEERGVGGNIADSIYGLSENYDVPVALDKRFAAWGSYFEEHWDEPDFDWPAFHAKGMALTDELRCALAPGFIVRYVKPIEDPEESRRIHRLMSMESGL
jgi:hypothetical protein